MKVAARRLAKRMARDQDYDVSGTAVSSFRTESEELDAGDPPPSRQRRASVVLVNLTGVPMRGCVSHAPQKLSLALGLTTAGSAAVLEKLDEQLLPSLYASVASSFSATAQELGWITFGRALVQALASPLGGLAGQQ